MYTRISNAKTLNRTSAIARLAYTMGKARVVIVDVAVPSSHPFWRLSLLEPRC